KNIAFIPHLKKWAFSLISSVITKKMLEEVYGVISSVNHDENGIPSVSAIKSIRENKDIIRKRL
ncbi:hypothetical protein GOQ29_14290, partial [Clostridium sp. D2Q-14]|nr:hypothetical protein [Anaeromonas gelatinilytica]